MKRKFTVAALIICAFVAACGINSVTKEELANVKAGNVLIYRFQRDGKSWFYADKITRIEGEKVYFNTGIKESTKGTDERIREFGTSEASITKDELSKFSDEQGAEEKKIIWIE